MDKMSDFSERLKELLFDNQLSPEQLAKAINTSRSTVYRWMKQPLQISLSKLIAVADYFCCSIEFLIGRSEDNSVFTPVICPKFSMHLRKVIKEKGFTTYSLRKISRFESIYFQKWDAGEESGLPILIELADILGCSIDYLIGRER